MHRSSTGIIEGNGIIEGGVVTGREVQQSFRSINRIVAVRNVQILPNPPNTIDHAMMEIEDWITGTNEHIRSWITCDSVVSTAVQTDQVIGSRDTIESILEVLDGLGDEKEVGDAGIVRPGLVDKATNVSFRQRGL